MHMQKNVFESLIASLMDTPKSKDGLKARKDMVQLNVMLELHPVLDNGKYTLPVASYNRDLQERRVLCTFVRGSKVLTRFSANPKKLVSMKDLLFAHCKASSCDADGVPTNCNQGYKARVLEDGYHPHVLLLFKDLTEDDARKSWVTYMISRWRPRTN
jgi:hypothetical protein